MAEDRRLEIEEITDPVGLEDLRPAWLGLWERCPDATPFQTPAWLLPWWRHFGQGHELLALALRDGIALAGLAPFYVFREPGGARKLLPVGIGVSDYCDPLFAPGHETASAIAILAHLARRCDRFDWCDLENLRPGSPLLAAPAPPGLRGEPRELGDPCPVLPLPTRIEDLARTISRAHRLPNYRRRAEQLGEAVFEQATAGTIDRTLDDLFRLHAQRWEDRGEPGVLADPAVRAFHRDSSPALIELGLLRFHGLSIDGRAVAMVHGFADRSRHHAYISGFDAEVPHPGLGTLIMGRAIEVAIEEGAAEFHFLRGREPYKYAWGAVDRAAYGRRLERV